MIMVVEKEKMAILIDRTSPPSKRYNIRVCHYCDHNQYPNGKPILPDDPGAINTSKGGDYKCGICLLQDLLMLNTKDVSS